MGWYVVYCKPRNEVQACDNLANQCFEFFYPRVQVRRRRSSGMATVTESLFPRYVFVHLQEGVDDFSKIRSTRGCVDLIRFGGKPKQLPDGFVDNLQAALNDDGLIDLTQVCKPQFSIGQQVRVAEGAFEGLMVEIAELKADDRALVLMEVLGGVRKVMLSLEHLE